MIVTLPENFLPEKKYIISTLLSYLGIKPSFSVWNKTFYMFSVGERKILFADSFFSDKQNYLNINYIPKKFFTLPKNKFSQINIPFLFGSPKISQEQNTITFYPDIFASAFFMLSRWEEYVIPERDKHSRFPDNLNLLKKFNLHRQPIICYYVYLLNNLFKWLGLNTNLTQHYKLYLTHDIDLAQKFPSVITGFKTIANDLIRRKSPRLATLSTKQLISTKLLKKPDPYDSFDFLMNIAEQNNLKAHFYFIPSLKNEPWAFYDYNSPVIRKYINKILHRNHIVGLHASYRSYNNPKLFKQELLRFVSEFNFYPQEGRQHFLRFQVPTTWQLWEQNNLKQDSTIGFYSDVGFRAGTCYPYHPFDVINRKQLNLIELPLILMDAPAWNITKNWEKFFNLAMQLKTLIKQFNGTFTILWHNDKFAFGHFSNTYNFYKNLIENLAK